jgi:hypothetical protein
MAWRENSGFAWVGEEAKGADARAALNEPGTKVLRNARPLLAGVPGIADIMGVAAGRAVALEVKDWQGRQETSQVRFERAFTAAGGAYRVVRSPEEAVAFLRATIGGAR